MEIKKAKKILDNKNVKITVFGKEVFIDRALEPSLYIWENMAVTPKQRKINGWLVMGVLVLILAPAYIVQFYLQQSVAYIENYESIDCDIYHDSITGQIYSEDISSANLD